MSQKKSRTITVELPARDAARLDAISAKSKVPVADLITCAVLDYIIAWRRADRKLLETKKQQVAD
jgi:hypothetical protein